MGGARGKDIRDRIRKDGEWQDLSGAWEDTPDVPPVRLSSKDISTLAKYVPSLEDDKQDRRALEAILTDARRRARVDLHALRTSERAACLTVATALDAAVAALRIEHRKFLPATLAGQELGTLADALVAASDAARVHADTIPVPKHRPTTEWKRAFLVQQLTAYFVNVMPEYVDHLTGELEPGYRRDREAFVRAAAALVGMKLDRKNPLPYPRSKDNPRGLPPP